MLACKVQQLQSFTHYMQSLPQQSLLQAQLQASKLYHSAPAASQGANEAPHPDRLPPPANAASVRVSPPPSPSRPRPQAAWAADALLRGSQLQLSPQQPLSAPQQQQQQLKQLPMAQQLTPLGQAPMALQHGQLPIASAELVGSLAPQQLAPGQPHPPEEGHTSWLLPMDAVVQAAAVAILPSGAPSPPRVGPHVGMGPPPALLTHAVGPHDGRFPVGVPACVSAAAAAPRPTGARTADAWTPLTAPF